MSLRKKQRRAAKTPVATKTSKTTFILCDGGKSKIHGIGLFAPRDISKGTLATYSVPYNCGGFNHSNSPNMELVAVPFNVLILALRDIMKGEELTVDYGWKVPSDWNV